MQHTCRSHGLRTACLPANSLRRTLARVRPATATHHLQLAAAGARRHCCPALHAHLACPLTARLSVITHTGVVGSGFEPNVPRPGSVDTPNPSAKLLEKQPINKVCRRVCVCVCVCACVRACVL
jgi:hypothetical protein